MNQTNIFLAQPTYGFGIDVRSEQAVIHELGKSIRVTDPRSSSWIPYNFNLSWCECLNRREEFGVDYFMMLHADIKPEFGFASKMRDEMQRTGAHLLAAIAPFKNYSGLTSTALDISDGIPRRLTMKEIAKLPETFSLEDCKTIEPRASFLLINTGLLIVDLNFIEALASRHRKRLRFSGFDWLEDTEDGKLRARMFSEDWFFSKTAAELGARVMATRKVKLSHIGQVEFSNQGDWGQLETDI